MEIPQWSLAEIDDKISHYQNDLSSLPRSHPQRLTGLRDLAKARIRRFRLTNLKEDMDKGILHLTEAILLPPGSWARSNVNVVQTFFLLALTLINRFLGFKQPEDVRYSNIYLRYLRGLPQEASGVVRNQVTSILVWALGAQVLLGLGDEMQNIEEMVILCHEIFASDISTDYPTGAITALAGVVVCRFNTEEQNQPLGQVIDCLRRARMCLPDLPNVSYALAYSLYTRFFATFSKEDYEEATTILDQIIASHPNRDSPGPYQDQASKLVAVLALGRYHAYGNPEYLEEAISRLRVLYALLDSHDPASTMSLAILLGVRSDDFGVTDSHEGVQPCDLAVDLPSFPYLGAPGGNITELNATIQSILSMREDEQTPHIQLFLTMIQAFPSMIMADNIADVEGAIKECRSILSSSHSNNDAPTRLCANVLNSLLHRAFELTNEMKYLNESITRQRDLLKMPGTHMGQFSDTSQLVSSLASRFELLGLPQDLDEIMQLIPMAINTTYAAVPKRLHLACFWALLARISRHPSVLTAYENAMSLMQRSLSFAPTLQIQHDRLVAVRESCGTMPLDYASYQVHTGRLKQAIETLEQGRALLWSEMRGLRASIDKIREADPALAEEFAAVNLDLETLTTSVAPGGNRDIDIDDGQVEGRQGMDSFGRLVVKQQKLLEERDRLISQIQALPGFGSFLTAPSFDSLRSAASGGPVIIICHCSWRSDVLILLHDSPPSLITMTDNFYQDAIKLKDRLVLTRKNHRLESKQYQSALRSVLKSLYELVGQPVIQELRKLNIPEQSRIWWCPTSAFCSLPLHAMGPIPPHGRVKRYFSDLYISSYTPTLSTLIESRTRSGPVFEKPSILLVAQPDEALLHIFEEIWVIQRLDTEVTTLLSKRATPSSVVDGLRDHRFSHFACHGILESGKPFDASFKLYGGERLTLLNIVRSHFPSADFAFLSACHTAEITDESIADEALHLTAAMQYCGFRSVVGTMWALADTDGRDLAEHFYKTMYSDEEALSGVPYYARSARALRDAVQNLRRKKVVPLERWVNFVHFGA